MPRRWIPLAVALLLTAAGGTARAAAPPPVFGPADGVQATRAADGTVEIRFTGPAAAALDGHDLSVDCAAHPPSDGLLFTGAGVTGDGSTYGANGTVGADGLLRLEMSTRRQLDACDAREATRVVARAALDPAGAIWVDEAPRALALRDVLSRALVAAGYRSTAAMVGGAVVALDGLTATAATGQLGYWSDGAAHAVAATTSAGGRRLAIEDLGDGMLRTDVLEQGGVLVPLLDIALGGETVTGGLVTPAPRRTPKASPYHGAPVDGGDGVHPRGLTAMAGPDAAVAPRQVGVWTDGARHAVVTTTSSSGRRLVLADEGDGTLRTNVFGDFLGLVLLDEGSPTS
jgi:hypothetical protein